MTKNFTRNFRLERYIWICLTLIFAVVVLTLLQSNSIYHKELIQLRQQEKKLLDNIRTNTSYSKKPEIQLKIEGLNNPVKELTDNLLKHPEIIPYKGVLGGKMSFQSESNINILNSKWVLANFDDGHIGGVMLLEYKVSKNGKIDWRVIDSFLL